MPAIHQYQILVSNIGTAWTGNNPVEAQKQYSDWIKEVNAAHGRASGETVTLIRERPNSTATLREYDPFRNSWFVEVTDTFGGEANYCWAHRYRIEAKTRIGAIRKLSQHEGINWRIAYDGEQSRYNAQGACICAFIERFDPETHDASAYTRKGAL